MSCGPGARGAVLGLLLAAACADPAPAGAPGPATRHLHGETRVEDLAGIVHAVPDGWDPARAQARGFEAPPGGPWRFTATVSLTHGARAPTRLRVLVDETVVRDGNVAEIGSLSFPVPPGARIQVEADPGVVLGAPDLHRPEASPDHVVVVVVDTLRADHLGAWGYPRPTSPELDALAARGTRFARCLAPAPWTLPSTRAIVSGLHPWDWTDETPTLLSRLSAAGWATASITRNPWLDEQNGVPRGAARIDAGDRPDAPADVARAVTWLQEHADRSGVLLLHLMDPHAPYAAPGPVPADLAAAPPAGPALPPRKQALEDAYDAEIRYTDAALGTLARALAALPGRSLLVVTADHGEEFWEHGGVEHGHSLHGELLHVPLLLQGDDVAVGVEDQPVSLLDVVPTVLAWAGQPATDLPGRDLRGPTPGPPRALILGDTIAGSEAVGLALGGERYWLQGGAEHRYARDDLLDTRDLAALDPGSTVQWRERLRAQVGWEVREGAVLAVPAGARELRPELSRFALDLGAEVLDVRVSRADGYGPPTGVSVSAEGTGVVLDLPPGTSGGVTAVLARSADRRVPITAGGATATLKLDRPRARVQLGPGPAVPLRVGAGPVAWPLAGARHPLAPVQPAVGDDALRAIGYIE